MPNEKRKKRNTMMYNMKDDTEALKITMRESRNPRDEHPGKWTELLLRMIDQQIAAMAAGQRSARKHFIALSKELEYHIGFRYELIDPETHKDDPRKG